MSHLLSSSGIEEKQHYIALNASEMLLRHLIFFAACSFENLLNFYFEDTKLPK
jgi:hypothetical protein